MSRVLNRPAVGASPQLVAPLTPSLDPVVQQLLARAADEAYHRGLVDGRTQGRSEGRAEVGGLADSVAAVVAEAVAAARAVRAEQAEGTVALATAIAAHVLDREPGDHGQALLARVRDWLRDIQDAPVHLEVSAADADTVAAAVADRDDVTVGVGAGLGPGEARLAGRWAHAELTRAARWHQVREVLGDG